MKKNTLKFVATTLVLTHATGLVAAQDYAKYSPAAQEAELAQTAVSRLGVMVPMRDGVALSTDIYTPKHPQAKQPVILWRTPYNEHKLRGPTLRYVLESVKRGYTFIVQNERGRYFSQGKWEILGQFAAAEIMGGARPDILAPYRPERFAHAPAKAVEG